MKRGHESNTTPCVCKKCRRYSGNTLKDRLYKKACKKLQVSSTFIPQVCKKIGTEIERQLDRSETGFFSAIIELSYQNILGNIIVGNRAISTKQWVTFRDLVRKESDSHKKTSLVEYMIKEFEKEWVKQYPDMLLILIEPGQYKINWD
jgi:hypothetical protein